MAPPPSHTARPPGVFPTPGCADGTQLSILGHAVTQSCDRRRTRGLSGAFVLRLLAPVLLLVSLSPGPLSAQQCHIERTIDFCDLQPRRQLIGEVVALGANAMVGALTAGIAQHFEGGSFWKGFRRGAGAGSIVFAGKRLAVEEFPSAGLLGRGVAATGSSMVRNAAVDRPLLSEVILPVGPTRLYIRPGDHSPLRIQLDVAATVSLARAVADANLQFELETSLTSGAAVFRQLNATGRSSWSGREIGGVIELSEDTWVRSVDYRRRVLAHERVHVIQYDQGFILAGRPMEAALLPLLPGGRALERWFDFGLETPFWALLNHMVDYDERPWEAEAELLGRTSEGENPTGQGIAEIPMGGKSASYPAW